MSSLLKPWLILAAIFIAGGLTGSAVTMVLSGQIARPANGPGHPDDMQHMWMLRLTRQLNLTADQQARIEPIVHDTAAQMQKIHNDEFERIRPILQSSDDQIAAILTPDQQAELKKMIAEREDSFSKHGHPWGPPREHEGPGMHFHDDHGNGPPNPPPSTPPATNATTH